jgi:hypothetical protein
MKTVSSPEYIALLRQQQALLAQMADITLQLEAINKALLPPQPLKRKRWCAKTWISQVNLMSQSHRGNTV